MKRKFIPRQRYRYSYLLRVTGKAFKYFITFCFGMAVLLSLSALFNWHGISQWILCVITPKLFKATIILLFFAGTVFFLESLRD